MTEHAKFCVTADVFVIRNGKLLLGKRKNTFGEGFWGLPGGHLEFKETFAQGAARELQEETGMSARDFQFIVLYNNNSREEHYIHVGMLALDPEGEPRVCEPDKCEEWRWFDLTSMPRNEILWVHLPQIDAFLAQQNFIDHS